MSSRSRRKTLCHNEIETFLNDLNNDDSNQSNQSICPRPLIDDDEHTKERARKRRTTLASCHRIQDIDEVENFQTNSLNIISSKKIEVLDVSKGKDSHSKVPTLNEKKAVSPHASTELDIPKQEENKAASSLESNRQLVREYCRVSLRLSYDMMIVV